MGCVPTTSFLFPLARLCRARGKSFLYIHTYPRVPYGHPRLSMIRRLRRRYTSNQFCAFCRMTRSVYTLCGFQKLKPVGFCVFCEFCGNYKQRRYKYKSLSQINCNLHFNKRSVYAVRVVKVHGGHDVFFHHGKTFA